MKYFLLIFILMFSPLLLANEVTAEWSWPTEYCDATVLNAVDIQQAELYIDTKSIQSFTDIEGGCSSNRDAPPLGTVMMVVQTTVPTATFDLLPGQTYYFRMRVLVGGVWSNLSLQTVKTIDMPVPGIPIIIRLF